MGGDIYGLTNVILCTGRLADIPYHFAKIEKDIYSVEELCYVLMQNAFLMDTDSFELLLAEWLKKECALAKLSEQLADMIRRRCSAEAIVSMILRYVNYCPEEEIKETEEILRNNSGLNLYEKKLTRANYLMENLRYAQAFEEFDEVLAMLPLAETELKAQILHNKGVMYANLFVFEEAAELFDQAYQLSENRMTFQCALAARRMSMTDEEYVDYIAMLPGAYNDSLLLEQRMNDATKLYELSADRHRLHTISVYKAESNMQEYYERTKELTEEIRDRYRDTFASEASLYAETDEDKDKE